MEVSNHNNKYTTLAKLVLFFSKWDIAMIDWYLEIRYGHISFQALKESCRQTIGQYIKDDRLAELYPEKENLSFLFRFLCNMKIKYIDFEERYANSSRSDFMYWMNENINSTYRDIYYIYLLGYMYEWATFLSYTQRNKTEEHHLLIEEIIAYLKMVEKQVCPFSAETLDSFLELHSNFKERFDFLYINKKQNSEKLDFMFFEKYIMLFKKDDESELGESVSVLFQMLNSVSSIRQSEFRLLKHRIKKSEILEYFQECYDKECIRHMDYEPFDFSTLKFKKENKQYIKNEIDKMFKTYPVLESEDAKNAFANAIELGYIEIVSEKEWKWTKKDEMSENSLAYLCGKIYLGDEIRDKRLYQLSTKELEAKGITLTIADIRTPLKKLFGIDLMHKRTQTNTRGGTISGGVRKSGTIELLFNKKF